MARFGLHDLHSLETSPSSPGALRSKVAEMIVDSMACRAKVEAVNPETGEYRVVLQGTLDTHAAKWEQS